MNFHLEVSWNMGAHSINKRNLAKYPIKPIYLLSDILWGLDQHNEAYVSALTSAIIEVFYTFFHRWGKFSQLIRPMSHTMLSF